MSKHFSIDSLKNRIEVIKQKFSDKQYFMAKESAVGLYNEAVGVQKLGNITEVLLDAICQVQEDMKHAYDFGNFDAKEMLRHIKYASSKANKNNVTESPAVLAAKANAKTKKKGKK